MRSVNLARLRQARADLPAAGGAMEALRAATSHCHRRLEQRLNIARRFADRAAYRAYLQVMFGYYFPFEQCLTRHPVRQLLPDCEARGKAVLLAADLAALGMTTDEIGALRHCPQIPRSPDEAAAFGSLYVLEGATLGGQVLLSMAESKLQLTSQVGARYLASYGRNVPVMWQRFCLAVEGWCTDGTRRAAAAAAAVATFESLEEWLCA